MRLLLIDDDPRYRTLLRHHISCEWPDVDLVSYNPRVRGPLTPGFLAQGYSVVLLDHQWRGGSGLDWLRDFHAREGFAPVIFLAATDDSPDAVEARASGAFEVIGKAKIKHTKLNDAIRRASDEQAKAQSRWRMSPGAKLAQDFAGARLKAYRRIDLIAKGSVSELFLAESAEIGGVVVLKVTPAIRKETGVDQSMERFLQEFEILRGVRHPNVVQIYDLGVSDDHLFLAMEHFARGDLRKRMSEGLTARQSLAYARDMAYALQAIHEVGVLHRDLKPGNVMLRDDGSIALIDFGLAKHVALKMEVTDKGLIFGTPHYMSPEQGHGKEIDARSDIYSLGIVVYEMLTGKKPFDADNHMAILVHHAKAPIPRLPERLSSVQPLIDTLLAKEANARPADADTAAKLIEFALDAMGPAEPQEMSARREAAAAARYQRATGDDILRAATPRAWVDAALANLPALLIDHANCEKKAASTALALMFAYPEDRALSVSLARLAREELKHFEQVERLMKKLDVPHVRMKPGRYASELRKLVRTHDPKRKLDLMIVHALIEARSCERFRLLAKRLPPDVRELYEQLERSEARHFEIYLDFARREFDADEIASRLDLIATREAELASEPDAELRFHSGPPR